MRHKFHHPTVKEWLKSVLNYRSYPKIKLGIRFFGPPCRSLSWLPAGGHFKFHWASCLHDPAVSRPLQSVVRRRHPSCRCRTHSCEIDSIHLAAWLRHSCWPVWWQPACIWESDKSPGQIPGHVVNMLQYIVSPANTYIRLILTH